VFIVFVKCFQWSHGNWQRFPEVPHTE
jgi:hypothetical protein